jgi:hypothetical protein
MFFTFDKRAITHPSEDISAFVDGLIRQLIQEGHYYVGPDRRAEHRHAIAISVRAMPLTKDLQPAGEAFVTTTKDISRKGIALIHGVAITSPFLAIELTDLDGKKFQGAVEIRRCRPVGPYFEIAGEYVTKVYDLPRLKPNRRKRKASKAQ